MLFIKIFLENGKERKGRCRFEGTGSEKEGISTEVSVDVRINIALIVLIGVLGHINPYITRPSISLRQ